MRYAEMTVEDAMKICNKNDKVLVAIQDLEDDDCDILFVKKKREEYDSLFKKEEMNISQCLKM